VRVLKNAVPVGSCVLVMVLVIRGLAGHLGLVMKSSVRALKVVGIAVLVVLVGIIVIRALVVLR